MRHVRLRVPRAPATARRAVAAAVIAPTRPNTTGPAYVVLPPPPFALPSPHHPSDAVAGLGGVLGGATVSSAAAAVGPLPAGAVCRCGGGCQLCSMYAPHGSLVAEPHHGIVTNLAPVAPLVIYGDLLWLLPPLVNVLSLWQRGSLSTWYHHQTSCSQLVAGMPSQSRVSRCAKAVRPLLHTRTL